MRAAVGANQALTEVRPASSDAPGSALPGGASPHVAPRAGGAGAAAWLRSHRRQGILVCFVVPSLVYVVIFFAYPLAYGITMSLEKIGFIASGGPFVGLHNYKEEIDDPVTGKALIDTAIFLVASIFFQFTIGLGIASYFNRRFFLSGLLRSLIIIPWLFPPIASGTIFAIMFAGQGGIIDEALRSLHLISSPIFWFDSSFKAMFVITFVNVWIGIPFNAVLLYSGLQDIPGELGEAASLDGCGPWQRFRYVTVPLLRPVSLIVIMLGVIYTVKTFDLVIVLTNGGPDNGSQLMSTWVYTLAFQNFQTGDAAAVGNMLFLFCMVIAFFYIRATRREVALA
ncbi:MAG TPA: sugar ABC transporter permease [Acidimicrobiales bacterium]|nr:sugar ABC transporter permease [Acidimicrobiales bacterium]